MAAVPHCSSARDCSLAGTCSRDGASCLCDGWTHGARCEVLNLLPVVEPVAGLDRESVRHRHARLGYRNHSGYNSWGGAALPFGGKWYLFASQMAGKCPLLGWWSLVSEVVRGVADTPSVARSPARHALQPRHPRGTAGLMKDESWQHEATLRKVRLALRL